MVQQEGNIKHEAPFSGFTRPLQKADLPFLRPILETWIRDRKTHEILTDEVEETLKAMDDSITGKNERTYFVAETENGDIIGSIGMRCPDSRLLVFTTTDKPVEMINAFVSNKYRRRGVGRALMQVIEITAKKKGFKELILDSGPRYMLTGWGAWMKLFGEPIAIAKNYYGENVNAPVWRKLL